MLKSIFNSVFKDNNLQYIASDVFSRKLSLLDIGARWGAQWPWTSCDEVTLIMVEPDPEEAKRLAQNSSLKVLPYALWNKEEELFLNINNSVGTSSIYKSDFTILNYYPDAQRFQCEHTVQIATKTIDNLYHTGEIKEIDFVKIDVQGGELNILKGGEQFLRDNLVGLETEVEFVQMYENQPLFTDVHEYIKHTLGL